VAVVAWVADAAETLVALAALAVADEVLLVVGSALAVVLVAAEVCTVLVVVLANELAAFAVRPFVASFSFSFLCCVQVAEAFVLMSRHRCILQKTLRIDREILLGALPFEVTFSANLEAHSACVASVNGHCFT
jgi:hypothetical protein